MKVRYITDQELTDEHRRIDLACKHATEDAWRKLREAGLPRVYIEGDDVMREWPDGRKEFVKKVECP